MTTMNDNVLMHVGSRRYFLLHEFVQSVQLAAMAYFERTGKRPDKLWAHPDYLRIRCDGLYPTEIVGLKIIEDERVQPDGYLIANSELAHL